MFTNTELFQIQQKGITEKQVMEQVGLFKKGFTYLVVTSPAIPGDGIIQPGMDSVKEYADYYINAISGKEILKFVPASGAATRMFKSLFEYLTDNDAVEISSDITEFIENLDKFAFYDNLRQVAAKKGKNIEEIADHGDWQDIIKLVLEPDGLNYGNLPKGLLKFHTYKDKNRTALEEHLAEGALYAVNSNKAVNIHFTVSPEHIAGFKGLINEILPYYLNLYGLEFHIDFSIQKPSTDTIAVDKDNNPFRDNYGNIVFRPGGHGALLENLNDLKADLIFIKNIDNVVPDRLKEDTVLYKKALGGLLLKTQDKIFSYIRDITNTIELLPELEIDIIGFIQGNLGYRFTGSFMNLPDNERREIILNVLNRPIRVCGMVKNTGEPGGGPFWVQGKNGEQSLQILESSQFNLDDNAQYEIFKSATHFNPVDLVISTTDYKGNKFDLLKYRDPDTGFISTKSKDGRELKALELPGLWNGAMANWNTIFVEVPISTFNPVKTIFDLLRPEHL